MAWPILAIVIAFCFSYLWPRTGNKQFTGIERWFASFAGKRGLAIITLMVTVVLARLAILPWVPIPEPAAHDEFSYLLAGDTYASGRLTNPTPQQWEHFESFHINLRPTYTSMYFPGQGIVLAAGKVLFGHPWYGVVFSVTLMCGAILWMLQGWLPPAWALAGAILAWLQIGWFSYWMNSYWGGAMSATGGALALGAFARIRHQARIRDGLLLVLGVAILANTRPWEGLLVAASVAGGLLWWGLTQSRLSLNSLVRRLAIPMAALVVVAAGMAYYNYRVTGNPAKLAYMLNRTHYAGAPEFLLQKLRPETTYNHEVMRDFYARWERAFFQNQTTWQGFWEMLKRKILVIILFFFGPLTPCLVMLPKVLTDRRLRFLLVTGVILLAGISLDTWFSPHYVAPFAAAMFAILVQSMRHIRAWWPGGRPVGIALIRAAALGCVAITALRLSAGPQGLWIDKPVQLNTPRGKILQQLERLPGPQLVIVRYGANHDPHREWVYNAADLDKAKVVWAREMDSQRNQELLRYFRGRTVWLVQPDLNPPALQPYVLEGEASAGSLADTKTPIERK